MMLVDRAKKDFDNWCINPENNFTNEYVFKMCESGMLKFYEIYWNRLPIQMRLGFYIYFFNSVGVPIGFTPEHHDFTEEHLGFFPVIKDRIKWKANESGYFKEIDECVEVLIKEACRVYNDEQGMIDFKKSKGL